MKCWNDDYVNLMWKYCLIYVYVKILMMIYDWLCCLIKNLYLCNCWWLNNVHYDGMLDDDMILYNIIKMILMNFNE